MSSYLYVLFSLVPKNFFFSAKILQLNVNYSNTIVFTYHLYDSQETESKRWNQTEVLLQRNFRFNSLNKKILKYCIQA